MAKRAESAGYDEGLSKGWDDGAEAMRAECLVQVVALLNKYGISEASPLREETRAALEGATP